MYSQSPHFQRKEVSGGSPARDYRSQSPMTTVNLRTSASGSSLTSPSKNRRIRSSPRSPNSASDSPKHHISTENIEAMAGYGSPNVQKNQNRFFQTSLQNRSSSMSNVGMMRDHSLERRKKEHIGYGYNNRDRSLDRQTERYRSHDKPDGYSTYSGRDRSHERDYPVMGARSLEREHSNLHRSRSIDHEYILNQSAYFPDQPEYIHTRETLILDFQSQIAELNKECAILHNNLDTTKEKLSSSMNSIKTFWSPELKKERVLRKEETNKVNNVMDQLRLKESESKRLSTKIRELENEIKHADLSRYNNTSPGHSPLSLQHNSEVTAIKKEKQAKEIKLLRKTIEEMELRIETQKQTLNARDASIKKLLEMLQSKGLASKQYEEDKMEIDRWRGKAIVEERKVMKLEVLLEQKENELAFASQELKANPPTGNAAESPDINKRHSADLLTLEAMVETKDVKIRSLEKQIQNFKVEIEQLRDQSTSSLSTPSTPTRTMSPDSAAWKSQEKLLKSKLENVKCELTRKETEITSLESRVTTAETQASDKEHLVQVLKEQVSAKEKQSSLLQADVDSLRERLTDHEKKLEAKSKQLLTLQSERKQHPAQLAELKDQIDLKNRRVTVLEKKVDSLEESVKEKEGVLHSTQARLSTLQADHSTSDTTLASLHETIEEKEAQITKLKDQRNAAEKEHQTELDLQQKLTQELKVKLNSTEAQISGRQQEISDLKEEISVLKQQKVLLESQISVQKNDKHRQDDNIKKLNLQIEQLKGERSSESQQLVDNLEQQIKSLKEEVTRKEGEVSRTQNEVDRLLDILRTTENEKNTKDDQIKELQDQVKEHKNKIGSMKKAQQDEKSKNVLILEEAQKRENNINEDSSTLKQIISQKEDHVEEMSEAMCESQIIAQKEDRVEELSEALRESVRITAQREIVVHDLEVRVKHADMQMKTMMEEMEMMREQAKESSEEVSQLRERLHEKGDTLKELQSERNKHMLDVYDMKQEAILAAITEKDAHVALIEMSPNNATSQTLQEVEALTQQKQHLQKKLKELTEQRMVIVLAEEKIKSSPRKSSLVSNGNNQGDSNKESIWT